MSQMLESGDNGVQLSRDCRHSLPVQYIRHAILGQYLQTPTHHLTSTIPANTTHTIQHHLQVLYWLRNPAEGELFAKRELRPRWGEPSWPAACQVLASMNNLEDVQVSIEFRIFGIGPGWSEDELILFTLRPLRLVRARHFSVMLDESLVDRIQNLLMPLKQPFKLVPRERPVDIHA